jgi:hypothetical protein
MQMDKNTQRPLCGTGSSQLGARENIDIHPDDQGNVQPGKGGMSVTPDDPKRLPPHYRPQNLGGLGRLPVFSISEQQLGQDLVYRPDPKKPTQHGFIEPGMMMKQTLYQNALAKTEKDWSLVP